jgi:hypothetical protein
MNLYIFVQFNLKMWMLQTCNCLRTNMGIRAESIKPTFFLHSFLVLHRSSIIIIIIHILFYIFEDFVI